MKFEKLKSEFNNKLQMHHSAVQESLRASNLQLVETTSAAAKMGNIIAQMLTNPVPINVDKEIVHGSVHFSPNKMFKCILDFL